MAWKWWRFGMKERKAKGKRFETVAKHRRAMNLSES